MVGGNEHDHNDEEEEHHAQAHAGLASLSRRCPGAFVFASGGQNGGMHSLGHARRVVALAEVRRHFVVQDAFGGDVRHFAFQPVAHLDV